MRGWPRSVPAVAGAQRVESPRRPNSRQISSVCVDRRTQAGLGVQPPLRVSSPDPRASHPAGRHGPARQATGCVSRIKPRAGFNPGPHLCGQRAILAQRQTLAGVAETERIDTAQDQRRRQSSHDEHIAVHDQLAARALG